MAQKINVVHLIWIPYGITIFQEFIDSYLLFDAGYDHELVLLFNGIENKSQADKYHDYMQKWDLSYKAFYYRNGQDIEAYRWISLQLTSDYILFLNSYAVLLHNNWLLKFITAILSGRVGIVAATGSWQSHVSLVFDTNKWHFDNNESLIKNFKKYKLLFKAYFLWQVYFKKYPNPHLRTSSFMIIRSLFNTIRFNPLRTKMDAYRMESGRNSITIQILKKGYHAYVLGKNGQVFYSKDWFESQTFFSGNQVNLLIADNRTEEYENANEEERKRLSFLIWGNVLEQ